MNQFSLKKTFLVVASIGMGLALGACTSYSSNVIGNGLPVASTAGAQPSTGMTTPTTSDDQSGSTTDTQSGDEKSKQEGGSAGKMGESSTPSSETSKQDEGKESSEGNKEPGTQTSKPDTSAQKAGEEQANPQKDEPPKEEPKSVFLSQGEAPQMSGKSGEVSTNTEKTVSAFVDATSTDKTAVEASISKAVGALEPSKMGIAHVYLSGSVADSSSDAASFQNSNPKGQVVVHVLGSFTAKNWSVNPDVQLDLLGAKVNVTQLNVNPGSTLSGSGQLTGDVTNDGTIKLPGIYAKDTTMNPLEPSAAQMQMPEVTALTETLSAAPARAASESPTPRTLNYYSSGISVEGNYTQKSSAKLDLSGSSAPTSLYVSGKADLDGALVVTASAAANSGQWDVAVAASELDHNFDYLVVKTSDADLSQYDQIRMDAPVKTSFEKDGKTYQAVIYNTDHTQNKYAPIQIFPPSQTGVDCATCSDQSVFFALKSTSLSQVATQMASQQTGTVLYASDAVSADANLMINNPGITVAFLKGINQSGSSTQTITVQNGTLVLDHTTYNTNIQVSGGTLQASGVINGDLNFDSGTLIVRADLQGQDFAKDYQAIQNSNATTGTSLNAAYLHSPKYFGGTTLGLPIGLKVNNLTIGNTFKTKGVVKFAGGIVEVANKLSLDDNARIEMSYYAQENPSFAIGFVLTSLTAPKYPSAQTNFTLINVFLNYMGQSYPVPALLQFVKGGASIQLGLLQILSKNQYLQLLSAVSTRSVGVVHPLASNASRVAAVATPEIRNTEVTLADGSHKVLPLQVPTAISRYASLLESDKTAAQALEGTEFTQALSNNARTHVFLSNDNLFQLLGSQGLRSPKVAADALYLKTYADGHADLEQLSLTAPVPGGLARVSVNRVGSSFNASYSAPNKGEVDGKKPANSSTTAYGVHALLAQDLGRFNPALSGVSAQVQGAFEYYNNKLNRLVDSKLDALEVKYGQSAWSLGLSVAKRVAVSSDVALTPFAGYRFAYESQEAIDQSLMKDVGVSLQVGKQSFVRNSLVSGATLRWVAPKGQLQGLSAEAGVALSYRFNAPKDYTASIKGADQSVNILFKDSKAFSTQLKLGVNYQYEQFSAGLNTQLYYAAGLNYSFGASASLQF